jgi:hypothetical protein
MAGACSSIFVDGLAAGSRDWAAFSDMALNWDLVLGCWQEVVLTAISRLLYF